MNLWTHVILWPVLSFWSFPCNARPLVDLYICEVSVDNSGVSCR